MKDICLFKFHLFNVQLTNFFQGIKNNVSARKRIVIFLSCIFLAGAFDNKLYADVTLTTSSSAAANINQGSNNNIIYVTQMTVTTGAVIVNNIQFTLTGTLDANDLTTISIYFNANTATISGSTLLNNTSGAFASGHAYTIPFSNSMAVGSTGYYIIAVNVDPAGTDNHTIKIDGAANPVVFGFTTTPNIINNQSDLAGAQTIQASDITLATSTQAAANINQGSNNNIVYVTQVSVATEPVIVNNIQFTLTGTLDANDLTTISIYFNANTATISGSTLLNNTSGAFASGHAYTIPFSNSMAVGSTGYYIIAVNVDPAGTDNHTIKIDGAANPVVFGFTTTPNIINNQSDLAGAQTIQASDITLATPTQAAANINQGSNNNIVYVTQVSVATEPVIVNNIQFTLTGTLDANDLTTISIYFNANTATISGSTLLNNTSGAFASGHAYTIPFSNSMAVGSTGYYIIAVNVDPAGTDNHTIKIDGAANPVIFGFTTTPNIINNQSNLAGAQTIQASDITLATSTQAAANINQGSNNNIVYVTQVSVATEPVIVNNIQFTLTGTLDANDLTTISIYFNANTATISGSTLLNNTSGAFASGHAYTIPFSNSMAVGSTGYYIIAVNVDPAGTDNHTIKIDGAANPVIFGFTTTPNIINNQSDLAGAQTIQASDITLATSTQAAANINQGSNNNIVYVTQVSVATEPVIVNNIQFTLTGTLDANDLTTISIYFNANTATISGSTLLNNTSGAFASGHAYTIPFSNSMAVGSTGYYIIAVNVDPAGTDNHTIKIDGAANPVVFGFTTTPNIINNQSDLAGAQTIQASDIILSTSPVATNTFPPGSNNNIVYVTQVSVATEPVIVNNIQFTLTGTLDANDLTTISIYFNANTATISGSTLLNNTSGAFASGHAYAVPFSNNMTVGSTGYYIIAVNVDPAGTIGHTVLIDGTANPVIFGFTTTPNITNNQSNNGGLHTLPLSFINVRAYEKGGGVELEWKVGSELNIDYYIVERSIDGRTFNSLGQTVAGSGTGIITYNFLDAKPPSGNNFYRITAVNKDGRIEYSQVIRINIDKGKKDFAIYPNPVIKNGQVNLEFQNLEKGGYTLTMFNQLGQQVMKQIIQHEGGTSVQAVSLQKISAGAYTIEVRNQQTRFVRKLIIE